MPITLRTIATVTALALVSLAAATAFAQMDAIKKKGCQMLIEQQEKLVNEYADKKGQAVKDAADKAQKASSDFRSQKCTQFTDLASKQSGLDEKIAKMKGGK
jgi:hypothetical protein